MVGKNHIIAQIRGCANFPSLSRYDTGILLFWMGGGAPEDTCVRQNWRGWQERSGRAEGDAYSGKLGAGCWREEILELPFCLFYLRVSDSEDRSQLQTFTFTQPRSFCRSAAPERNRTLCHRGGPRRTGAPLACFSFYDAKKVDSASPHRHLEL